MGLSVLQILHCPVSPGPSEMRLLALRASRQQALLAKFEDLGNTQFKSDRRIQITESRKSRLAATLATPPDPAKAEERTTYSRLIDACAA